MTTKHTADMREEFMFWFKQQATTEEECPSLLETWQAATASAEAEYLPVIEKAMQRIEEALPYVSDSHARATLHMMKAELAAPYRKQMERV